MAHIAPSRPAKNGQSQMRRPGCISKRASVQIQKATGYFYYLKTSYSLALDTTTPYTNESSIKDTCRAREGGRSNFELE